DPEHRPGMLAGFPVTTHELTQTVPDELSGIRLQDFLERSWPAADRLFLRRLVAEGRATVNYEVRRPQQRLKPGDWIRLELPEGVRALPARRERTAASAAPEGGLAVLAEADFALVVDKPAGLPC